MGARTKLNEAYVLGAIVVGGLAGGLTGSWLVFGVVAMALVATSVYSGDIRGSSRRR